MIINHLVERCDYKPWRMYVVPGNAREHDNSKKEGWDTAKASIAPLAHKLLRFGLKLLTKSRIEDFQIVLVGIWLHCIQIMAKIVLQLDHQIYQLLLFRCVPRSLDNVA